MVFNYPFHNNATDQCECNEFKTMQINDELRNGKYTTMETSWMKH